MLAASRVGGTEPNEFGAVGRSYPESVNQTNFLGLSEKNIITLAKRGEPGTFKNHFMFRIIFQWQSCSLAFLLFKWKVFQKCLSISQMPNLERG